MHNISFETNLRDIYDPIYTSDDDNSDSDDSSDSSSGSQSNETIEEDNSSSDNIENTSHSMGSKGFVREWCQAMGRRNRDLPLPIDWPQGGIYVKMEVSDQWRFARHRR